MSWFASPKMREVLENKGWVPQLEYFAIWRLQSKIGTGCTNDKENNIVLCKCSYAWPKSHTKQKWEEFQLIIQCPQIKKNRLMHCSWWKTVEIDVKWETFSQNEKQLCVQKAINIGLKHYKYYYLTFGGRKLLSITSRNRICKQQFFSLKVIRQLLTNSHNQIKHF